MNLWFKSLKDKIPSLKDKIPSLKGKIPYKKTRFLYLIIICIGLFIGDQLFKSFISLHDLNTQSVLGFALEQFKNPNWIFGLQFSTNYILMFILLSGLCCLFIYFYILILYNSYLKSLHFPLVILLAGILSNMVDRIQNGYVVDFIYYKWGTIRLYFNSSDILQTLAWVWIIWSLFSHRKQIWRKNEQRSTLFIMKKQQFEFVSYITITVLCIGILFVLIHYQFINYLQGMESLEISSSMLLKYSNYLLGILVAITLPIVGVAIYFSNKIYGPLYAFNKYIKQLLDNKNPPDLKLRKRDVLKEDLEELALKIKNKIAK